MNALWRYLKARLRMIGRCPPHRYVQDKGLDKGHEFPFCIDCGEYK